MLAILAVINVFYIIILFVSYHPVFGAPLTKEQRQAFKRLEQFENGKFFNKQENKTKISPLEILSMFKEQKAVKHRRPRAQLDVVELDWNKICSEADSITWFGHSAFLISIDNKKILVDPMLSHRASPVSFIGSKRYTGDLMYIIEKLPKLDAVLVTHDHYDHLDYKTILKLKDKTACFCVPLGVDNHLLRWGVEQQSIIQFNWWDEYDLNGIRLAFTPSRHFSGRALFERNQTLWGGWVILGSSNRLYTSGDGGYGEHFTDIQARYGEFDLVLMEGGQYDKRWEGVHMLPEEAVQACKDVNGKTMMLIHWAGFTLANHSWTEPIERAEAAAAKEKISLIAPRIGETVELQNELPKLKRWWENL